MHEQLFSLTHIKDYDLRKPHLLRAKDFIAFTLKYKYLSFLKQHI